MADGAGLTLLALTAGTGSLAGDVLAAAWFVSGFRTGVAGAGDVKAVRGAFISFFGPFGSESDFVPGVTAGEFTACILSRRGVTVGAWAGAGPFCAPGALAFTGSDRAAPRAGLRAFSTREPKDMPVSCRVATSGRDTGASGVFVPVPVISFDPVPDIRSGATEGREGDAAPRPAVESVVRAGVTLAARLTLVSAGAPLFAPATFIVLWPSTRSRSTVTIEFATEAFL